MLRVPIQSQVSNCNYIGQHPGSRGSNHRNAWKVCGPGVETPIIICTSTRSDQVKDLTQRFQFAEITLGSDVEVLQGLLGRVLRRKMLNIEVSTRLANLDMPEAIQWLLRIYCNLYIFVKTTSQTQSFLSPSVFMSCPVDSTQQMKDWFIQQLWNSSIVNILMKVVSDSGQQSLDFEDPVKFVIRTWPCREEVDSLPQHLLAVRLEEPEHAVSEDPLMSMLMSLQQATLDSDNLVGRTGASLESLSNFDCQESPGTQSDN